MASGWIDLPGGGVRKRIVSAGVGDPVGPSPNGSVSEHTQSACTLDALAVVTLIPSSLSTRPRLVYAIHYVNTLSFIDKVVYTFFLFQLIFLATSVRILLLRCIRSAFILAPTTPPTLSTRRGRVALTTVHLFQSSNRCACITPDASGVQTARSLIRRSEASPSRSRSVLVQ